MKLFVPPIEWDFSQYMPYPLAGIVTGGCVGDRPHPWGLYWAHSHCRRKGNEPWGWICIRYPEWTTTADGRPTPLVLHELAHILTDEEHTVRWAETVVALGGIVEPEYSKVHTIDRSPKLRLRGGLGSTLKDIEKSANRLEATVKRGRRG